MPETFFAPGQKSHCVFSPDLWCDPYNPTADFAPFEFLSDIIPQTVGVVIPPQGEIWDRVYETIESIWQDRRVGFHCKRVTPEAWTEITPCVACNVVRVAQVVIIDFQSGDERASGFREMAALSNGSLQLLKAFGPAPTKRVILIGTGAIAPPPLLQKVFDWIDYTGEDGKPDIGKLAAKMEAIAQEGLFQAGETMQLTAADFELESAAQSPPPVAAPQPAAENEIVITVLDEVPVATTSAAPATPEEQFAEVMERAETLANQGRYADAFLAVRNPELRKNDTEGRIRQLERECIARMPAQELARVYFGGLTGRHRSRFEVQDWSGDPASARLVLHGEEFSKRLGALEVALYACDRLEPQKALALHRHIAAGRPAFVLIDGCEEDICRTFAARRGEKVYEIHVPDLRRWALGGKSPTDGLRDRLQEEYRRPEDLFLRGLNGPVSSEEPLFGRQNLLNQLRGYLRSGESFVVHGLPRSGKSSLLWRLSRLSAVEGDLLAIVDVQSKTSRNPAELYAQTVRAIKDAVQSTYAASGKKGLSDLTKVGELFALRPDAPVDAFRGRFETDIKALGETIRRKIDSRFSRLIILFDELDSVMSAENRPLLNQLQNLTQEGVIAIGITGPAFSLQEELSEATSPLRGLQQCVLAGLDEDECGRMVRNIGHRMYAYFEPEAVSRIAHLTGGHPMLVRSFCSVLLESLPPGRAMVTEEEVNAAVDLALEVKSVRRQLERIFKTVSRQFLAGADVLQALAQSNGREEPIDPASLAQTVGLSRHITEQHLALLSDYGLATRQGGEFRARIGLLSRWLRRRETE